MTIPQNPWISIVVPSYNQAQFIEQTLKSLFDQNEPGLEIIVVDGGSSDNSVEIIQNYADHLAWWVSEPDRGQSHALNKGFARAKGEWLGWLNSDDLLLPNALHILHTHIKKKTDSEWWIGGGYFINDKKQRFRNYIAPIGLEKAEQLNDWSAFWFAQPSTFFRRDLYERAGGNIREELHYAMDLDLWLRLIKQTKPSFIDAELSIYRHHIKGKTHALSEKGEGEIVKVLVEHLDIDQALARVGNLAKERNILQINLQQLEARIKPLLVIYRWLKKMRLLLK